LQILCNANLLAKETLDNVSANGDNGYSTTKYIYDFYGRPIAYTDGLNNNESYQYYDLTGQLYIKTLRNGNTFTYIYDNAGNLLTVTGVQTGKIITLTYTYDKTGNVLTSGDGTNNITYQYDSMGNCTRETDNYNGSIY
jgi:YD repeat-containing protein